MARVVYAARVLGELEQIVESHRSEPTGAVPAVSVIRSAITGLATHPLVGRSLERELRELVISLGRTGFVALYRFALLKDEVQVLALRRQRAGASAR